MFRKTTITAVVLAVVTLVPAAWAKHQPVSSSPDAIERAVLAREQSQRLGASPDAFERAVTANTSGAVREYRDAGVRNAQVTVIPTYADAFERAVAAQAPSGGAGDRSEALNRTYGLGEHVSVPMTDVHDRSVPVFEPSPTPISGSGRDLEWPQIGIGFGIGLLLALGLGLAARLVGVRPLAH